MITVPREIYGLAAVFAAGYLVVVAFLVMKWADERYTERVRAKIVSVKMRYGTTYDKDHTVWVDYSYGGKEYHSVKIAGWLRKEDLVTGYVDVWVDPKRPDDCIFKRQTADGRWV